MEKSDYAKEKDTAILSFLNDVFTNTFYISCFSIGIPQGSLKDVLVIMSQHTNLLYESSYYIRLEKDTASDFTGYTLYVDRNNKNGKLYKVTKDHTLVNLLVATGELTQEEAKYHPRKNVLMRALGANDPIEIDIFDVDTSVKGLFLCSDGLTNMLTEEQIEKILNSDMSIEDIITKLIRKANSRGGTDNITVAYLKKESGDL